MSLKARVKNIAKSLGWRDWLPEGVSVQQAEAAQRELAERLAEQVLAKDATEAEE